MKLLGALAAAAALAVAVSPASHAAAGSRFIVEIGGLPVASFVDASMVYGSVDLVHGSASPELVALLQSGKRSDPDVVMLSADGKPVARYHLEHAWPSKLEIGAFDASKNEVAIETLDLYFEAAWRVD